jgi:hypothetical protein
MVVLKVSVVGAGGNREVTIYGRAGDTHPSSPVGVAFRNSIVSLGL